MNIKITKCIMALFTGLFVASGTMMADNGAVSVTAGDVAPNPACGKGNDPVTANIDGSPTNPSDTNCETMSITNKVWSWSASKGSVDTSGTDGSWGTWSWTPNYPLQVNPFTISITITGFVTFEGICGTNVKT
jgi:hypothetical protein